MAFQKKVDSKHFIRQLMLSKIVSLGNVGMSSRALPVLGGWGYYCVPFVYFSPRVFIMNNFQYCERIIAQ